MRRSEVWPVKIKYFYCPMAGERLSHRTGWIASLRRSLRKEKQPMTLGWYNPPVIPKGYRGKLD